MRIALVHTSVNALGGGERLLLATIEALRESGWEVTLATVEPTDWDLVNRVWGRVARPHRERVLAPFKIRAFGIYMRLMTSLMTPFLRRDHDIVFNTHGDVLVTETDITYIHFPTFALWDRSYSKYEKGFWRIYFAPYYSIQKRLVKKHISGVVLTNSRFSQSVIQRYLKRRAMVVYPPVDVERYLGLNGKRENIVVTIGRFNPEKRYEFILDVARRLPDLEFHICGSLSPVDRLYFNKLVGMVEGYGLSNVFLHPNMPQNRLEELLSQAKIYMHSMIGEHFGIAVVEGMASGLVPVVHRSGGPWTDIIDYGRYGYGYTSVDEAVKAIRLALENYEALSVKARERAKTFSKDKYKKRIMKVINTYYLNKKLCEETRKIVCFEK